MQVARIFKKKTATPSGLQRAHDFSTCHMQNLAQRVISEQRSSSAQRSGEAHNDDDPDDHDGNSNAGGYEDDGLSHGTSGESEEPELRNMDSRYGDVLERLERGNDPFRGNDASHDADGEKNGHDWLGRNDFVVDGEYPIGEVLLLPLTTPLYWKYNRGDGTFRHEYLDTSSQDWLTYCRMRILQLSEKKHIGRFQDAKL